jgi:hypothetical protein
MASNDGRKECPSCGLRLPLEAKVCEFCGYDLEDDDWIAEIEKLEKEIVAKGQQPEEALVEEIESTIRESDTGAPKPPAPPPPEPEIEPEPRELPEESGEVEKGFIKCTTCGGEVGLDKDYCPHCGADLSEEVRWASEIEELEHELNGRKGKREFASLDEMIASTIKDVPSEEPEEQPVRARVKRGEEELPEEGLPEEPVQAEGGAFKCPACGEEIGAEVEICPRCGADVGEEARWESQIEGLEQELSAKEQKPAATLSEEEVEPAAAGAATEEAKAEAAQMPVLAPIAPMTRRVKAGQPSVVRSAQKTGFFELKEEKPQQPSRPKPAIATAIAASKDKAYQPATRGLVNGTKKGMVNGTRHGRVNGTKQGRVNGTKQGRVNGTKQGRVNGTKQGRVNGTSIGKVNGLKKPAMAGEKGPSRLQMMVGGRVPMWQLIAVIIVAALVIMSAMMIIASPSGRDVVTIDGVFSDWTAVPSYNFLQLIPGELNGIDVGKVCLGQTSTTSSTSKLYVYANLQSAMFAGSDISSMYVFIDKDANPATGYNVSDSLGADLMVTLAGWDGVINQSSLMQFTSTQDRNDWNSWQSQGGVSRAISGREMELAVTVTPTEPVIQLMTSIGGSEYHSPLMSPSGTILARQEPLISGSLAQTTNPSVLRVNLVAMGVPQGNYIVQPSLIDKSGASTSIADITVGTAGWIAQDLTADVSALQQGESFTFRFSGSSSGFEGTLDVIGTPCSGYYMQYPSQIVIDGLFADWNARKIADQDLVAVGNPSIDIDEYGAVTQNNSHFMYVGTVGKTFEGADVPEQRSKVVPSGQGGGSGARLKKTGEDLLQAFIDINPSAGIGKTVTAGNATIKADLLIEIYGREGIATSSSVKNWSVTNNAWNTIGAIEKIGIGENGVEFSVNKTLLGNLTASETIFFTTDWKARSDHCWLSGALTDPWIIRGTDTSAAAYRSNDGAAWAGVGSISLESGDVVVALAHSLDRSFVFAVTNSGRIYDWEITVDTSWGSDVTGPCNATDVVGIAPNTETGEGGCMIIDADGWIWTNGALGSARGWTNGTSVIAQGAYDFKDICYNATGERYWAMRSGANTPAYYLEPGQQWNATAITGSAATQMHVYNIGDDGATVAGEEVFVICEDGSLMYSADGGANWAPIGDLPAPGEDGLPSYSRYVAIDRDADGTFWTITNTSYCYKSSDRGVTWIYTGNIGVNDIASLACPVIPEFDSILIPIIGAMFFALYVIRKRRADRETGPPKHSS